MPPFSHIAAGMRKKITNETDFYGFEFKPNVRQQYNHTPVEIPQRYDSSRVIKRAVTFNPRRKAQISEMKNYK